METFPLLTRQPRILVLLVLDIIIRMLKLLNALFSVKLVHRTCNCYSAFHKTFDGWFAKTVSF